MKQQYGMFSFCLNIINVPAWNPDERHSILHTRFIIRKTVKIKTICTDAAPIIENRGANYVDTDGTIHNILINNYNTAA